MGLEEFSGEGHLESEAFLSVQSGFLLSNAPLMCGALRLTQYLLLSLPLDL